MRSSYDALILRFDGGCRGENGETGCGWVLMELSNYEVVAEGWHYVGEGFTNNVGEYYGLIKGLEFLVGQPVRVGNIHIQGDSELVINQMKGAYAVRAPNLVNLHATAWQLCWDLDCCNPSFVHIGRSSNGHADRLASKAIDNRSTSAYWIRKQHVQYRTGFVRCTYSS